MIRPIQAPFGKGTPVGGMSEGQGGSRFRRGGCHQSVTEGLNHCTRQSRETNSELYALQSSDPFYTRVLSLFESYGTGVAFVGFWAQIIEDQPTALISRFEDKFSLYLTGSSDLEEIAAFLHFQGAGAVMAESRFFPKMKYNYALSGQVLRYRDDHYISDLEIYEPEIKEVYDLLLTCESEIFRVPPYLSFLSDVTHRRNLGKCTVIGTKLDGALASSVMTVSETEHAAILGAVATHPDCRKRGLSRELVRTLASRITGQGRAAYVFSASDQNTRFYQNSGFEITAGFREIFL